MSAKILASTGQAALVLTHLWASPLSYRVVGLLSTPPSPDLLPPDPSLAPPSQDHTPFP
jgi:hypothetical protein